MTVLIDVLNQVGIEGKIAIYSAHALAMLGVLLIAWLANVLVKKPVMRVLEAVVAKTPTSWDDALVQRGFVYRLTHLAPALVIYILTPHALDGLPTAVDLVRTLLLIYMVIMATVIIDALLDAFLEIYGGYDLSREMPLKGAVQLLKVVVYIVAAILVMSTIVGKNPLYILSGLGALTAVLMLIFKDSILGFVAGIQLTANKMVAIGDWIEMPAYGADGDVIDVALTTVKVQNWDKTITTIPTYALISESFRNWRGMSESGGRRIKRSLFVDMNTIRFCDDEMLRRFSSIQYIAEYLEHKRQDIEAYNREHDVDDANRVNGRHLTNVGTFRAYITAYLRNHPLIHQDMTFLVRQLQPGPHGLPIEIYVFSKDQVWANYEGIQSDIFDHILAVVPEFDLRVFQFPTGADLQWLATTTANGSSPLSRTPGP